MKLARVVSLIMLCAGVGCGAGAQAAGGDTELERSGVNVFDAAARQRGAKYFVNYCLGCHSAKYMRYNRLVEDLGLSEDQVRNNFIFDGRKLGSLMTIAMDEDQAEAWFGVAPPDLSVVSRSRGSEWLYGFLRSFYIDDSGNWDNEVFPGTAMPHVLWELQGVRKAAHHPETGESGAAGQEYDPYEVVKPGLLSEEEFDQVVRDLATYFEYMGDPSKLQRKAIGIWVILFLVVLTGLAYLLKAEYWRDVK